MSDVCRKLVRRIDALVERQRCALYMLQINWLLEAASSPERIVTPAVRYRGRIYKGVEHGMAMVSVFCKVKRVCGSWFDAVSHPEFEEFVKDMETDNTFTAGFITSSGRFLSRDDAASLIGKRGKMYSELL